MKFRALEQANKLAYEQLALFREATKNCVPMKFEAFIKAKELARKNIKKSTRL